MALAGPCEEAFEVHREDVQFVGVGGVEGTINDIPRTTARLLKATMSLRQRRVRMVAGEGAGQGTGAAVHVVVVVVVVGVLRMRHEIIGRRELRTHGRQRVGIVIEGEAGVGGLPRLVQLGAVAHHMHHRAMVRHSGEGLLADVVGGEDVGILGERRRNQAGRQNYKVSRRERSYQTLEAKNKMHGCIGMLLFGLSVYHRRSHITPSISIHYPLTPFIAI